MKVREGLGRGIRKPVDDLHPELLELTAGDDGHFHALRERDQLFADPGIDGALGRSERVVEVERDEAGRDAVGHGSPVLTGHAKGSTSSL
jgi:hypothetical protein